MCPVWLTLPSAWTLFKSGSVPVALSLPERSACVAIKTGHQPPSLTRLNVLLICVSYLVRVI